MEDTNSNKEGMREISPKIKEAKQRTHLILEYIRKNPLTTSYKISQDLKISYTSVHRTVRELIFCNLIDFKLEIGENHQTQKVLFSTECEPC